MPYRDKKQDRDWHRNKMRERRLRLKLEGRFVTPSVTPNTSTTKAIANTGWQPEIDADGNIIYE